MTELSPADRPDTLDAAAARAVLRAGFLAAVTKALGVSAEPVAAAALNRWLDPEEGRGGKARRALGRAERWLIFVEPPEDRALWSRLAPHVRPRGRDRLAEIVAVLRRERQAAISPVGAGALFLPLAAATAADPVLQLEIAQRTKAAMETKVLFHPDSPPRPVLAAHTLLLLLTGSGVLEGLTKAARETLADLATTAAGQPAWADFWDLWFIGRAVQSGSANLPALVPALPHWAQDTASNGPETDGDIDADATPQETDPRLLENWQSRRPGYCIWYQNWFPSNKSRGV
jgi:hypothetical protein